MPPLLELSIFLLMTFATHLRFNSGFFRPRFVMAFVTGDAIYSFLGMLAVHPGLKDPPRIFLMTGEAIANFLLGPASQGRE